MVRFENDKLVIEIKSAGVHDSLEKWMLLHGALCDVASHLNKENICGSFQYISGFMKELEPEWEVAKKMLV